MDAEQIARGLSEAQKRAVMSAYRLANSTGYILPSYRDRGALVASIISLGLATDLKRLNRNGLAVRAKLLESRND